VRGASIEKLMRCRMSVCSAPERNRRHTRARHRREHPQEKKLSFHRPLVDCDLGSLVFNGISVRAEKPGFDSFRIVWPEMRSGGPRFSAPPPFCSRLMRPMRTSETKKADVTEYPQVFEHVGLLTDRPPGISGLPFS
jgi:hypothetical protein